jgi:hypothetical protein
MLAQKVDSAGTSADARGGCDLPEWLRQFGHSERANTVADDDYGTIAARPTVTATDVHDIWSRD